MDNPQMQTEDKKRFVVNDEQSLKWVFQLMESKRKQITDNQQMAQDYVDFYKNKNEKLRNDIYEWKKAAEQYAADQMKEDPKWTFKDSPFGRIVLQKAKKAIVKKDQEALIKAFKDTDYVKSQTTYKLDWKNLSKQLKSDDAGHVFTEDGEIVAGARVDTTPAHIVIKHKNDKGNWTTKEV